MGSLPTRLLPTLFLLTLSLAPLNSNAQTFTCGTSDSTLGAPTTAEFYPYRPGVEDLDLIWRDVEFMWDALYPGGLSVNVELTLMSLAKSLVDSTGKNPFGAPYGDMRLIYDYFRREGDAYNLIAADTVAMRLGVDIQVAHLPKDRSHLDCYIKHPTRAGFDGQYPAAFTTADEDLSSDRPAGYVRHQNSIHITGPPNGQAIDVAGTGWTAPDRVHNLTAMHEFQHSLPPEQGAPFLKEWFSAGAEAIAGYKDPAPPDANVAYTWSLLSDHAQGPCGYPSNTCFRAQGTNYQGRSLFAAYLAYNFRGSDTTATLAAMADDLLWKWAKLPDRSFRFLRTLLSDNSCGTCVGKNYFHPGGVAMDSLSRLALLHHNWRVANYVNNSSLDEGQYGYPPQHGFAPGTHVGSWRIWDPGVPNDVVAIPPEVTLNTSHRTRDMVLKGERSLGSNTYPLVLAPYGAEYWVVRSDPAIWATGQDLIVRVNPEDIHRLYGGGTCEFPTNSPKGDARLAVSVVAYSPPSDSVASGRLWAHPEWATSALPPQWVDVDSVAGALEFVVPNFGDGVRAAVIVISLADGPSQVYTSGGYLGNYVEALHYRVELGLRRAPYQPVNPMVLAAGATTEEDFPTWSPSGSEIAYSEVSGGVSSVVRKLLSGGSPQVLTAGREPDWSPRGDLIAFARDSLGVADCVWIYDTLTTLASQITGGSGKVVSPTFSPNGRHIAYARWVQDFTAENQYVPCTTCGWEVRRVEVGGSNNVLLARLYGEFEVRSIRWSPDGRWLYLKKPSITPSGQQGPDQLWIVAADGTQAFTRSGLLDDARTFDLHSGSGPLALEQAGSVLWPNYCGIPGVNADTTWNAMPYLGLAVRDTASADATLRFYRTGAQFHNPRWSPDGTRIAYSSNLNKGSDSTYRDLFVGQVSYNHAPTMLVPTADILVHTGRPYDLFVSASDSDGETLTYQSPLAFRPPGASFAGMARRFSWQNPGPVCSEYYVVFRVLDASGGVASKVIKFTAAIDSVNDLSSPIVGDNDIWLAWTAPGDNGALGRGVEYELRYAIFPLHEANFGLGTPVSGLAAPAVPGGNESHVISGLTPGTTYYIAIRTRDLKNNWSVLGNVLQITTTTTGQQGGYRAQEVRAPLTGLRTAQTAISRPGGTDSRVTVLAVEMGLENGAPSWSVRELRVDEIPALGLGDSTAVLLQAREAGGTWTDRARIRPEHAAPRFAIRALDRPGRIIFMGAYGVRQAWNSVELDGRGGAARLMSARHSRLGDVKGGFDARGTTSLDVAAAESLTMAYEVETADSETAQDWYLLVGPPGSEVSAPLKAGSGGGREQAPLPTAFRLKQNQPNPFSSRTTIHFDLPAEARVRLEVFDAQGRLVRTLADGDYRAGFHAAEWDHRSDGGQAVGAGVYLYRLHAGSFSDQRKMVLLGR